MSLGKKLFKPVEAAAGGTGNQEEGLIMHLDANDEDSYDGDGSVWYDIKDHEYTPAINPGEHFNTVTYTGNGTSNSSEQSITGVGFQPDLVWIKNRGETRNHVLVDSLRKTGNLLDELHTNTTDAANTTGTDNVKTIDSDGFTLLGHGSETNDGGDTFVAWCLKAGGAAVSNTDGSTTSQVSVNNDLGFSIVKTSNTSGAITFGHGLDSAPEMIINKGLTTNGWNWLVYHKDVGTGKYITLNSSGDPTTNAGSFSSVTSTTITNNSSNSSSDYINYCFTSKKGVSKVGTYTGNGGTTKVYTGFEPAFVMVKRTDSTGDWTVYDNKRGGTKLLFPYLNYVEGTYTATYNLNFKTDGFSISSGYAVNGGTYIYLAFATEKPSALDGTPVFDLDLSTSTPSDVTVSNAVHDEELGNFWDFTKSQNNNKLALSKNQALSNRTIEIWCRADTLLASPGSYLMGSLPDRGYGSDSYGSWDIYINNVNIVFVSSKYNGSTYGGYYGPHGVSPGEWFHVAMVCGGTTTKGYINGVEIAETSASSYNKSQSVVSTNVNNITLGFVRSGGSNTTYGWDGQIGDVRIYDSMLTHDQIIQNYRYTKNKYPNGNNATGVSSSSFNTNGYFNVPTGLNNIAFPFNFKKDQTLVWWAKHGTKTTADSSNRYRYYMFDMKTATYSYWQARVDRHATNGYQFQLSWRQDLNNYIFTTDVIDTLVNQNDWNMYACYFTGTEGMYYSVNGGDWNSGTSTLDVGSSSTLPEGNFLLGKLWSNGSYYSNPNPYDINNIKVYDRVLTSSELSALNTAGYQG